MKAKTLALALLLACATLPFVPEATAVGTCSKLLNAVEDPDCPYLFCYGTRWSYPNRYVECQNCFDPSRPECRWPVGLP